MEERNGLFADVRVVGTIAAILLLGGCAKDAPPIHCIDPDYKCYIDHAVQVATVVRSNIDYWSNVRLIGEIAILVSGIVSSIMLAIQGDDNKHWTKPIGLTATALVTGLTSAIVSFHVVGNIDKLVDVYGKIGRTTNQFETQLESKIGGQTDKEIQDKYRDNKEFRDWFDNIAAEYAESFNDIKLEILKISGSAAQLNSTTVAPLSIKPMTPPPNSKPASDQPSKESGTKE